VTPWRLSLGTVCLLFLAACGGGAAPSSPPAPASSAAAAKPASAAASAPASAKPAASAAASASAKPAASASAKPAASGASAAPKPTATTLPVVDADTTKVPLTRIPIPPIAGKTLSADIMEVDQETHLLYVTDRTTDGVDVFDVSKPEARYLKTIKVPGGGTNGLTIAKNVNKVAVGNNDSSVSIIDIDPKSAKADTVIATLSTGGKKRTDETDYDPNTKKLYAANSDDQFVTVIDMATNQIVKKIDLPGGALEQPRYNPADKMMYLTGSEDNVIYQFNTNNDTLVKKFDIGDKCNPNGIGINPTAGLAVLGCSNRNQQHTAVWDLKAAKVVSTTDKVGSGDAVIYDAKADRFFFAASNFYRGGQMGIFDGKGGFITNVPTAVGAHGVAFDETNNIVYTQDQLPGEGAMFSFPLPGGASAAAKPAASAKPSA